MKDKSTISFIPMLAISNGTMDVDFYKNAFGAIELRRFSNDDGSIHVSELEIEGAMFRLHEENPAKGSFTPLRHAGATTKICLMVPDMDVVMNRAIAAGAQITNPAQDYDYGYRQGDVKDPFGHVWTIETTI